MCENYETPLMAAVKTQSNDIVKDLCENGADINKTSRTGETAIYQACDNVNITAVRCLLSHGADVNIQTNNSHPRTGHTPLMAALPSCYSINIKKKRKSVALNIVQLLISHGCDLNARFWNGNTALHIAQEYHDVHTVCILAENGALLHIKNKFGFTAFEDAIQPNKQMYDVAYALLLYGYNMDEVNSVEHPLLTILRGYDHEETKYFHPKLRHQLVLLLNDLVTYDQELCNKVKELVASFSSSAKAQIQTVLCLPGTPTPDSLKWTCRKVIRRSIKYNMFNKLWTLPIPTVNKQYLSLSLNVNRDPVKLLELILAIQETNIEQVTALVESNIDINYSFIDHTPLTAAAQSGCLKICKLLIQHGARVNMFDNTGLAPLHWAASSGELSTLKEIVRAGADVNSKDELKHENALIISAAIGHFPSMMYLLEKGCDPDVVDETGRSAIHYTSSLGMVAPTAALLAVGVSPRSLDRENNTPLHIAASHGLTYKQNTNRSTLCSTLEALDIDKYNKNTDFSVHTEIDYSAVGKMLLQSGAALSDVNINNLTPIDLARLFHCEKLFS